MFLVAYKKLSFTMGEELSFAPSESTGVSKLDLCYGICKPVCQALPPPVDREQNEAVVESLICCTVVSQSSAF